MKYECTECGKEIESDKKPSGACPGCGARGTWKKITGLRIAKNLQDAIRDEDDRIMTVDLLRQHLTTLMLCLESGVSLQAAVAKFQKETGMLEIPVFGKKTV